MKSRFQDEGFSLKMKNLQSNIFDIIVIINLILYYFYFIFLWNQIFSLNNLITFLKFPNKSTALGIQFTIMWKDGLSSFTENFKPTNNRIL